MCPFLLLTIVLSFFVGLIEITAGLTVRYSPQPIALRESDTLQVSFEIKDSVTGDPGGLKYDIQIADPDIARCVGQCSYAVDRGPGNTVLFNQSFNLEGMFLGRTDLVVVRRHRGQPDEASKAEEVIVKRKQRILSTIFTISVITLVSLNSVVMGATLDMGIVKSVLRRPVAPLVGFISQFAFMPLVSFFVGQWLLSDTYYLWLGLFTFGCSPAGGASNMWTVLLNGNLDLSITMTFISCLGALFMLPFWMYTLGRHIYAGTATRVPARNLLTTLAMMAVCLGCGLLIQKYRPNVARVCKRILAPISIAMIVFIVIFGTYANLYMFKLMNFRILLSTAIAVWCAFLFGFLFSTLLRLPLGDRIAISIETGVQNTGVAIALLGFTLAEPSRDIASVVPVAASIVTPIPLTIIMIIMKIRNKWKKRTDLKHKVSEVEAGASADSSKDTSASSSMSLINQNSPVQNDYRSYK